MVDTATTTTSTMTQLQPTKMEWDFPPFAQQQNMDKSAEASSESVDALMIDDDDEINALLGYEKTATVNEDSNLSPERDPLAKEQDKTIADRFSFPEIKGKKKSLCYMRP